MYLSIGMDDYIAKPMKLEVIKEVLKKAFESMKCAVNAPGVEK
ncbi:hypothetical protein [Dyadobacter sp. CY261]|nr:hypothetical protein [Dyadobacter sp. CY261]